MHMCFCVLLYFTACMLYYCNTVGWAWWDWGLIWWLTILLQCFDPVGWVTWPVKISSPNDLHCVEWDVKPYSTLAILLHPPVHSSLKITERSFQHAAPHFGTNFLPVFVFLINLVRHHHPALILDRLLIFLKVFPLSSENLSFLQIFIVIHFCKLGSRLSDILENPLDLGNMWETY